MPSCQETTATRQSQREHAHAADKRLSRDDDSKTLPRPLTCENAEQNEDCNEQGNSAHYGEMTAVEDASLNLSA
jgi:hypothetical protein